MIRYKNRTVFPPPAAHGLVAVLAIAALNGAAGHAQSTVMLRTHAADLSIVSSDSPSQLPTIVSADAAPLQGQIVLGSESRLEPDAASANSDSPGKFSVVVTSMFDHRVIDRCELKSISDADPSPMRENTAVPTERWEFQLAQRLPSGVYELKLEPTVSVSSRFRELLAWERSPSKDRSAEIAHTFATQTWPLIVLPKTNSATSVTAESDDSRGTRQLLVHWDGFAEMAADAESLTSASQSNSPFAWILTSPDHVPMTPSQRWAEIMQRIDERLDAIHAAGANGIVVDQVAKGPGIDAMAPPMILMQCLHAKAAQFNLDVWQQETAADNADNADNAEPTASDPDDGGLTLTCLESWPPAESSSHRLRVAAFLRTPLQTIRGQFPAEMDAALDADLLWFGFQSTGDEAGHPPLASLDPDTTLAASPLAYPLAHVGSAFMAEAWVADWSSWCIRHSALSVDKGLIVDEALLHAEMGSDAHSVGDVAMLWETCWSETSRWLADSALADASPSGGASAKSLVQVRHANTGDGTVLVCLNQAPWPMRVTFPLANLVRWADVAPTEVGSVHLTKPVVSELGSTLVIPASSILVCYAEQRISPAMQFSAETDDARKRVAELTRQVTTIVENLGILGEIAGMSSRANSMELRLTGGPRARPHQTIVRQASAIRSTAPSSVSNRASESTPVTGGSSFWSAERWGLSRAATASGDPSTQNAQALTATTPTGAERAGPVQPLASSPSGGNASSECRNLLENGGFELPHEIGVPGWMHAHHPSGAVEIDTLIRSEGRQSIRLQGKTSGGASAWLISREIARPIAGRLGISMSLRCESPSLLDTPGPPAESVGALEPIEIRVAIEGDHNGQPIRRSETVRVTPNGKWHVGRFVLQWLDVDPRQDHNLHITVDNLSTSTVWIDDIVVTDYFASAEERSDLQSLAYLAVQGLQHSDLRPAAKLMKNFWAQDLLRIANFQSISSERESDNIVLTRDKAILEKTRSERGMPSPAWGAGTVQANPAPVNVAEPAGETSGNAFTGAQLPRLPPSESVLSELTVDTASGPGDADSAASIGGKIRRWLPPPLKF